MNTADAAKPSEGSTSANRTLTTQRSSLAKSIACENKDDRNQQVKYIKLQLLAQYYKLVLVILMPVLTITFFSESPGTVTHSSAGKP